ncbi:MAG: acetamidase/formamidase family protein [Clostridiales bacterium]|nr:acetamidase/formamidase family protein [Clostridiales bacterium]
MHGVADKHTIHRDHHHFGWDRSLPPVLEVEPGATVEFEVVDASGGQLNPSSTAEDVARIDFARVNPVTGPVYIKGARPGDVLEVEILDFGPLSWGWTASIPGFGLLADEFPQPYLKIWDLKKDYGEFAPGIRIPLRPFPGTIGVALAEPGNHSIVPPRQNGGNMDIRHLTRGSRLYLPVWVEGALFSVGDTHAAQGDGEVCGTAIEAPMTERLRRRRPRGSARILTGAVGRLKAGLHVPYYTSLKGPPGAGPGQRVGGG